MKYKEINALDAALERIIDKTVKYYYTDWKNYDRPYYMKLKGSERRDDKIIILIARTCGSYLWSQADYLSGYNFAFEAVDYYSKYEATSSNFYIIDLEKLTIKKQTPDEIRARMRDYKKILDDRRAAA